MRYQISFKDEYGVTRKQGCFTRTAASKLVRELRMNGVQASMAEIDQRCEYCGGEDGWECTCVGRFLADHKPLVDPNLLHDVPVPE